MKRRAFQGRTRRALALATALVSPLALLGMPASGQEAPAAQARATIAPRHIPAQATNFLLVMTDDVGFGASSSFGGPIPTPNLDQLSAHGLRYNRFHTTAMCSPSRAALLTGRNHHGVGTGTVIDLATGEPGYNSLIPRSAATVGRVLGLNGYSTAWFGKNHNTPDWEQTPQGPFDRWPTGLGFDYFYGFMGGAADQKHPALVENTRLVEAPRDRSYLLDRDLADRAVTWLQDQRMFRRGSPFLLYLAPGTAHSPHQAPPEWIARFKGRFDQGWDKLREETLARQKRDGLVPADTVLTPRPSTIPSWESLSAEEKKIGARMMEVYAAQLAYFDDQFGRIVDELKRSGQYRNTAIIFIQGDNGASGEGTLQGTLADTLNPKPGNQTAFMLKHLDDIGGARAFANYPVGWGWAMNTPFQFTKQVASHLGGTRNGLVISWPARITDGGSVRTQYSHLIDVAPTIYEIAGIRPPAVVDGVRQSPLDGKSLVYSFADAKAPSLRRSQYYEMVGNQGWYEDGWLAVTQPGRVPWKPGPAPSPSAYTWQLYDLRTDYAQSKDLAAIYPAKLAELKRRFQAYARTHQLQPISNDFVSRMNANLRPYISNGRSTFEFHRRETRLTDQSFPDLKNRSWSIRAEITVPKNAEGAIIDQGGWFGGWGLFLRGGRPNFVYKASIWPGGIGTVASEEPLTPGDHILEAQIVSDGGKLGSGITVTLKIDGKPVATGHIAATVPLLFVNEGVGIGREFGTGLIDVDAVPDRFNGTIRKVIVNIQGPAPGGAPPHH